GQVIVVVEAVEGATTGERSQTIQFWVQATRIGMTAYTDGSRMTAWASSLVDGQPLPGVEFRLLPASVSGRTGANGIATLPLPAEREGEPFLVARLGNDVAILAPGMGQAGWGRWSARDTMPRGMWHSFTDRNLYRPGETVKFKGWLRWLRPGVEGQLTLPARGEVSYTVRDPRGEELAKGTAPLTELGGFDGSFALPRGANLGGAYITVRAPDGRAQHMIRLVVQEFRRPEYEVSVTADPGPHFIGGGTEVVARASYFSGGGLAGAPVSWEVMAAPGFYDPPGWDEWSFGARPPWWWWLDGDGDENESRNFEGTTDADGAHSLRIDFDRAVPPGPHNVTAHATITDVNRQTWTSSATMLVHPSSVYLGLRTERSWLEAGDTLDLELIAVDLDGRAVAGRTVDVQLRRSEWRFDNGRSSIVELSRVSCSRVSAAVPVRCAFPVAGGDYTVEATTTDERGRATRTTLRLWVTGPGFRFPGRDDDNESRTVEMIPDRKTYAVGDTARILLTIPFQPARGIVSIRRGGVARTEEIRTEGGTHTLLVPITEADVPNVWVMVELNGASGTGDDAAVARGVDAAIGTVQLSVPPVTRTLAVVPVPADSTVLPDAESAVEVEVRDAAGRPVADAEVALVVVDEAVLALTGYRITNPLAAFYPMRATDVEDVRLRPLVHVVVPELTPAPGTLVGRVVNAESREPIGGARVAIQGTTLSAVTDAHGRFRIRGVQPGTVTLVVEHDGFPPARQTVRVGSDATPPVRLYLVSGREGERAGGTLNLEAVTAESADYSGQLNGRVAAVPVMAAPEPPPPPPVMMPTPEAAQESAPPGPAIAVRANFEPLAVWMAAVRTDARGRVRVPFRIPSNLTRYRVSAVAVHGATRYGLGESAITARQPLMVRPSPPRFLNFGDRFELPVVIQNTTGAAMEVMVAARADGVTFTEPGRRVTVPAHGRVEVLLPAEAREAGTAHFQVVAASGASTDAAEFSLPVYTPATAESFATYGTLTGGAATLPLDVPMDAIPSFGGLEVSTTSTALHELTDAFLYLARYPYQGTEQIASR
ncbi:MAG TPA: MG2 domain-containing protein, partial [Longimicrobium sp.]|nr:MG2 domain-containing protein [Longimicrobium sp.]